MLLRAVHGRSFIVEIYSDGRALYNHRAIRGVTTAVVDVSVGEAHYALQGERGELYWCRENQATLIKTASPIVSISCGYQHTTIALQTGKVRMHNMHIGARWVSVRLPKKATHVYSGNGSSGALLEDGTVYTWGRNQSKQLGHSNTRGPAQVPLPGKVADFGFGMGFACALLQDGRLYTWGFNSVPRPRRMNKPTLFSRLAVGWAFIAAAHMDRSQVSMYGHVGGVETRNTVQQQPHPVSALTGGWTSTSLRAEYVSSSCAKPCARQLVSLQEHRWHARRLLVLCVAKEQTRRMRKRSRACADGAWSNKLPKELWQEVARYLG